MEGNHNLRSDPHSDFVLDFLYGARKFKILLGALTMGIFDDLAAIGQGDWVADSALAHYRGYDPDNTRRLLNTLAALKLLDRGAPVHHSGEERMYRNIIAVSRYLLKSSENSLVPLMLLEEAMMPLFQKNFSYVLKNGSVEQFPRLLWKGGYPQDDAFLALPDFAVTACLDYRISPRCHHTSLQSAIPGRGGGRGEMPDPPPGAVSLCPPQPPGRLQMVRDLFLAAWDGLQGQCLSALLGVVNFREFKTVVDLGAGSGSLMWHITQAQPHLFTTVYDTARIVESIPQPFAVNQNTQYVKGDFFKDPLPGADCYILSHVLHEYDDEKVDRLLARVCQHLNPGGTLIILEKALQDDKRAPVTCLMDDMLLATVSRGRQRSEAEYRKLLEANGLLHGQLKRILGLNTFDALIAKKPH